MNVVIWKKVYLMSYLHTYKQGRRDFPTWENIFQLGWIVNQAIVPLNNTLKHVEISLRFKKMNKSKTLMILMLMEFSKYTTTHQSPTNTSRSLPFFTSTKKLVKPPFEKSKQKAGRLISRKRTGILFFHFIDISIIPSSSSVRPQRKQNCQCFVYNEKTREIIAKKLISRKKIWGYFTVSSAGKKKSLLTLLLKEGVATPCWFSSNGVVTSSISVVVNWV